MRCEFYHSRESLHYQMGVAMLLKGDANGALAEFQATLLARAPEFRDAHMQTVNTWDVFVLAVATGWARALHCGKASCEDDIKAQTGATPRCVPLHAEPDAGFCVRCGEPSAYGKRVLFGRSY